MEKRKQEKFGWLGGWSGGFLWVIILAVVFVVQGRVTEALVGFAIWVLATAAIVIFAPWRFPHTRYRVLLLPVYGFVLASLAWGVWAMEDTPGSGLPSRWTFLVVLPLLSPLWTVGGRRWDDG